MTDPVKAAQAALNAAEIAVNLETEGGIGGERAIAATAIAAFLRAYSPAILTDDGTDPMGVARFFDDLADAVEDAA